MAYINDTAQRFSKNLDIQRDLKQEAACYLSLCVDDLTMCEYKRIVYNAMQRYYYAEKQERALSFETFFNAMSQRN